MIKIFSKIYHYYFYIPDYLRFFFFLTLLQVIEQSNRIRLLSGIFSTNFIAFILNYFYFSPLYSFVDFYLKLITRINKQYSGNPILIFKYFFYFANKSFFFIFLLYFFVNTVFFFLYKINFFSKIVGSLFIFDIQKYFFFLLFAYLKICKNYLKAIMECEKDEFLFIFDRFIESTLNFLFFYFFLIVDSPKSLYFISFFVYLLNFFFSYIFFYFFYQKKNLFSQIEINKIVKNIEEYFSKNYFSYKIFNHWIYRVFLFFHFNILIIILILKHYGGAQILLYCLAFAEPFFMLIQKSARRYIKELVLKSDSNLLSFNSFFNFFFVITILVFFFYLYSVFFLHPPHFSFKKYFFYVNLLIVSKVFKAFKQFFASFFVTVEDEYYSFFFVGIFIFEFTMLFIFAKNIFDLMIFSSFFSIVSFFFVLGYGTFILKKGLNNDLFYV